MRRGVCQVLAARGEPVGPAAEARETVVKYSREAMLSEMSAAGL